MKLGYIKTMGNARKKEKDNATAASHSVVEQGKEQLLQEIDLAQRDRGRRYFISGGRVGSDERRAGI